MKVFNSLHNNYSIFDNKKAKIYCCGPTVYDNIHIGNSRPLILTDILVRFLRFTDVEVSYIQNITDIDDKIIAKAAEQGLEEDEVSEKFIQEYFEDLRKLNVLKPTKIIPISTEMPTIINYINELIKVGAAYEKSGDVYFDVEKIKSYGDLSNRKTDELIAGSRVEINEKKNNPNDFTLWKKTMNGKNWVTKWSPGRPGWHTECVTLIKEHFNSSVDFHVGGIDLKFPHHENERAQFLATENKELAKIWIHNGHVSFNDEKMSKSLGNTVKVKDFISKHGANTLRYLLLTTHYKQPLDFNDDILKQSKKAIKKIDNLVKKINLKIALKEIVKTTDRELDKDFNLIDYLKKFTDIMENDLNTPLAITLIEKMIKVINKQIDLKRVNSIFDDLMLILQVLGFDFSLTEFDDETLKEIHSWSKALENKDFETADKIRSVLVKKRVI